MRELERKRKRKGEGERVMDEERGGSDSAPETRVSEGDVTRQTDFTLGSADPGAASLIAAGFTSQSAL